MDEANMNAENRAEAGNSDLSNDPGISGEKGIDIDSALRTTTFPSEDEIRAVGEGRACFHVQKPAFVISVANIWAEVQRRTGSFDPIAVDEVLSRGFQGLMGGRSEPQLASRAVEEPILEIARYRIHRDH